VAVLAAVLGAQLALAGAAWGSTGGTAYVLDGSSGVVSAFNTATNAPLPSPLSLTAGLQNIAITPGTPISVGEFPFAVAITPDGKTAYVTNFDDNTVTPITTATNTPGTPIPVGMHPDAVAVSQTATSPTSLISRATR
jgi:YVTN family beta-propeller protein